MIQTKDLIEFDEDEEVLAQAERSAFGIFPAVAGGFLLFGLLLAAGVLVIQNQAQVTEFISLWAVMSVIIGMMVLILIGVYIAITVYFKSKLIVTDQSISQVLQRSLFNRKVSQLGLPNVEDVTVIQPTVFSHLFHFGTVKIETAGEQANFSFTFAKDPYEIARQIVDAQEALASRGVTDPNN